MSKQFVGFSDDDIFKITRQTNGKDSAKDLSRPHRLPKAPPGAVKFVPPPATVDTGNLTSASCVDSSIYPNHPIQQAVAFKPLPVMMNAPEDESILVLPGQQVCNKFTAPPAIATSTPGVAGLRPALVEANTPFKGMSLKDFEQQRRLMEEQNRQKREILHKAIEQHAQKTAAEATKIQDIKSELTKLDSELASDVAILRKQIDAASMHFSNVEKNYLNIENMFLKAKVELHQALEKKEMLTEHLCAIISHNEERKAKRLTELMEKVGISVSGDCEDTLNGNSSYAPDTTAATDHDTPTRN